MKLDRRQPVTLFALSAHGDVPAEDIIVVTGKRTADAFARRLDRNNVGYTRHETRVDVNLTQAVDTFIDTTGHDLPDRPSRGGWGEP